MDTLKRFAAVLDASTPRLNAIAGNDAARSAKPGGWSAKQELGHLVDSAMNNYARIIRVQREDQPVLPGYDPDLWVERRGYQDEDWSGIIALWETLNRHMLCAVARIPAEALSRTCSIGSEAPITLRFLIEDYVDHMVHHLAHIGMSVQEFRRAESAYA